MCSVENLHDPSQFVWYSLPQCYQLTAQNHKLMAAYLEARLTPDKPIALMVLNLHV